MGFLDDLFSDPFGSLADLNFDGKIDETEKILGIALAGSMIDDEHRSEQRSVIGNSPFLNTSENPTVKTDQANQDLPHFYTLTVGSAQTNPSAWKENYEIDYETGINPDDYDTEDDYLLALAENQFDWREGYEIDFTSGVDPDDFETEEEFLEAVEANEWRQNYDYDFETGLDPDDYDSEEDYLDALEDARENGM